MADDRERNQGMKQGTGEGGGQHAPGRNPQDDRSADQGGQKDNDLGDQQGGQKGGQQGQQGSYQEGGQNEQTRR